VGGGGGGFCSGGGAGGVVMQSVTLPASANGSTTNNIIVNVGAGGLNAVSNGYATANGSNTTVSFSTASSQNITAFGGGSGTDNLHVGLNGASSGGGGGQGYSAGASSNNYNNYGNPGSAGVAAASGNNTSLGGGGGGAGTIAAIASTTAPNAAAGGSGIQCPLPGISTFAPNGTAYGTYYWGGGGGGGSGNGGASSTVTVQYGNGGIGGGGGAGSSATTAAAAVGGGMALNPGLAGSVTSVANGQASAGNAGANTGGGGGGAWYGTGGNGGSGIVIIAFPQTPITSNAQAVLPSALFSSGKAVDVLSYDTTFNGTKSTLLSSGAYSTIRSALSCKLVNYNYFGPVMTLRHSLDPNGNYTQNFYADVSGNLGTQYLGTGQSVSAWLTAAGAATTYAYVTKWYDQGMDISFNCAVNLVQPGNQPVYDVSYGFVNCGYTTGANVPSAWITPNAGNAFLGLPYGSFPYSDASYTFIFKHGNYAGANVYFCQGGAYAANQDNIVFINGSNQYANSWASGTDTTAGTAAANSVVTAKYASGTANSRIVYVNGTGGTASNVSGRAQPIQAANGGTLYGGWLGIAQNQGYGNAQFYYFYIFNSSLGNITSTSSSGDQSIIEATPSTFSTLPSITGLAASSITATTFALACSAVTNATNYAIYVNGAYYSTVAAVTNALPSTTVTPGYSGPWTVNVYAYNSSNVVIATGFVDTALVAYYPFSNNIYDYVVSTGINDATVLGTATAYSTAKSYKSGIAGSLYNSDGTYYGGNCPHAFIIPSFYVPTIGAITVAFWIYPTATTQTSADTIVFCMNGLVVYFNYINGSNHVGTRTYNGGNNVTPAPANAWTHVAYTYTSAGVGTIYINGSLAYTYTDSTALWPAGISNCNTIFTDNHGTGSYYGSISGYMNNFYLYTRALTPAQIYALYTQ